MLTTGEESSENVNTSELFSVSVKLSIVPAYRSELEESIRAKIERRSLEHSFFTVILVVGVRDCNDLYCTFVAKKEHASLLTNAQSFRPTMQIIADVPKGKASRE